MGSPIASRVDRLSGGHPALTEEQRSELLPTGNASLANRVGWARTYLKKAGLIDSPERAVMGINGPWT